MGHIKYASDVAAPVEAAFNYADNPLFVPNWMFGVVDFVPTGSVDRGRGAVFAAHTRVGILRSSSLCEITEYQRNAVIGYTMRGRLSATLTLRFGPLGRGRSVLSFEVGYRPPRGFVGRLSSGLLDALVTAMLRRTEAQLRREIEEFYGTDLVGRIA
ncbi:SRPBCC family protein [Nocardia sp. CNY236]|uniref:SRPBCC family protein n=1 Tax=Nocardia sp. CNY236 TaxID=1169152 RepID=UPI000400FCCC|nr:SRPBCC family protein [Nocardia sp. CNY236]